MTKTLELNRGPLLALGAIAGLLVGLLVGPTLAQSPEPTTGPGTTATEHTLTVSGTGTIKATPDVADVQLGIQVTRDTAKAARDDAASVMTAVVAALHNLNIADADIQTSYISIGPVYDYSTAQRITGYQVSNFVSVHVRDLAKVGDVIDDSVKAGATTVNSVNLDVSNRSSLEQQARTAAAQDARAHADALATGAGVQIVGVASISESGMVTPWPYALEAPTYAGADVAKTPVMAGTSDISATVSIVYLIQ
jgi:uncharacterized protein YggE